MQLFMSDKKEVKKYPQIIVRISVYEEKLFKQLKKDHNMSAREVLEYSSCPCEKCKGSKVIAYDKEDGSPIEIPRGIISKK